MTQKTKNLIACVCRLVLGLTFIASGFAKTVDPWGAAIKMSEYLGIYGFDTSGGYRFGLAIVFCAAELMLGLMLVFKIKMRPVPIAALLIMTFFLVLTFLSATVLPVEDCGCFSDAVKLSPWASFAKNVVLWMLALVVWLNVRRTMKFLPVTRREWICTTLFAIIALGLGTYCYRHLPLVDFLPYKKGANIYEAIYGEDTRDEDILLRQFVVFNPEGVATEEIVGYPGRVYIMCAVKLDNITQRCAERFENVVDRAAGENAKVVLITSSPISADETIAFGQSNPVEVYNVDATTMITMLRATAGMVVLDDGVIVDKKNCRDIK